MLGLLFCVAPATWGQIPGPVKKNLEGGDAYDRPGVHIFTIESKEDKDFFLGRTTRKADHIEVIGPPQYSDVIRALREVPEVRPWKTGKWVCEIPKGGFTPTSLLEESPNRITHFFTTRRGIYAMLTVWNFQADSISVSIPRQFITGRIQGVDGTISKVLPAGNHESAVWKATWERGGIQFELYLPDSAIEEPKVAQLRQVAEFVKCKASLANKR
jgi:hypothetical protein